MKSPLSSKKNFTKIALLLLGIAITSCNTLKRVDDNELLLTKNTIITNGEKIPNNEIYSLLSQKPNSSLLGYPLRLNLYNLAKQNPDSSFQNWLHKKENRKKRLTNFLSKKQLDRLGNSFAVKGINDWLKNIGEAPVTIDTSKTRKSLALLKSYYGNQGYFNAKSTFKIDTSSRKQRAAITYDLDLGKPFAIDTFSLKIASKAVDSIYQLNKEASFIKKGQAFSWLNFNNERNRLTNLFRNTGIHNFQEGSLSFDVNIDTITKNNNQKLKVELRIDGLRSRDSNQETEYTVNRLNSVDIYSDYNYGDDKSEMDSIHYNNYNIYYKNKLRYKPKALTDAIFLFKDSIYSDLDRIRTHRQITNLNTFKYPNIEFLPDTVPNKLITSIYLTPRDKFSLSNITSISHSNIQDIGATFSVSHLTRNVFGGLETLNISARGSLGLLSDASITDEDFVSEVGADINLNFPRIWLPFINTKKIIRPYMLPQTRMAIGTSFQKNIGLDKQTFNTVLGYNWSATDRKKNALELLNIQFIRNVNPDRFFNVYQNTYNRLDDIADSYDSEPGLANLFETTTSDPLNPRLIVPTGTQGFITEVLDNGLINPNTEDYSEVRRIDERRRRLTENNLIFVTNYTFTKDNRNGINDNSFHQFRLKLESAGNLLSGLSYLVPFNENGNKNLLVFGVPYSQYFKTEFSYIKHWATSNSSNVLAFRSFFGFAIPYGNSNSVPFTRSYFAGGSNDNRAWNAYSLGPGRTLAVNDFNEANLKIAFNLEYRFPIAGNIKGALFTDAGNIWNALDNEEDKAATFNGLGSLKDIALGSGFGIRYDFTYFVLRVDTGFKTYNPASETSRRWFTDFNFTNAVLNIGINYPF